MMRNVTMYFSSARNTVSGTVLLMISTFNVLTARSQNATQARI